MWAGFWFLFFMFLIFPLVVIGSFFGKIRGGNFVYKLLHAWSDFWFFMVGIHVRTIMEEKPDPNKQYVFVVNHISNLDAALLVKVIRQPFRPLGKIELKKVPVFGFIYKVCVVVVDRSNAENRQQSIRHLKAVIRKGISILIFPEGNLAKVGEKFRYRSGVWHMARDFDLPVVPVATNLGLFWPQEAFEKHPGTATLEFLDPIPPGLPKGTFLARLEAAIETRTAELVAEVTGRPVIAALQVPTPEDVRRGAVTPSEA